MKKDLVVEVYTEELPPDCVVEFNRQLPSVCKNILEKYKTEFERIETYTTPVRLIIYILNLAAFTKEEVIEIIGPSAKIGLKNGEFTDAAVGFARKYNVHLKELYVKQTEKGEVLALKKIIPKQSIRNIIADIVFNIISNLNYPKMMIWHTSKFRFPRPIRNLLVIYGNDILKVKLNFISSTDFTYSIKTYPLKKIKIPKAKKLPLTEVYFQLLKQEFIIYDFQKRYESLVKVVENIVNRKKLKYEKDEKLFKEITSIVEYPSCVLCEFPEEFLRLPKEFIITCMKKKQKFIPIYDGEKILNVFIGVKNGPSEHLDNVRDGYQKVLMARLNDVKYFYDYDRKIEFSEYFEKLKGITYNEKLKSSMYDKVVRLKELAKFLNKELNFSISEEIIEQTAKLIKNDLVTQIVYEYPELHGVAGRIYCLEYCKAKGLQEDIAFCCEEHLKPKDFEDDLPNNKLSILFSLADKLSTLIDQTVVDNLPSGSSDPLGLKKIADSVIKICLEKKFNLNFKLIVEYYLYLLKVDNSEIVTKFLYFISSRFENILLFMGYKIDLIRAILYGFIGDFSNKMIILGILKEFYGGEEFLKFVELYKRVYNIIQQGIKKYPEIENIAIEKEFFQIDIENNFYESLLKLNTEIEYLYNTQNFKEIILELIDFKPEVDKFFDKILIFDKNIKVAKNRLCLLKFLLEIMQKIGALQHIQI